MSFQWTLIATYLYFEIVIVILMMLPIFSPRLWNQFFKSRLFALFQQHAAMYFYVLLGVLGLFLMDAIREMRKYSHNVTSLSHTNLSSEMKGNVKLFRAQRNFYITGFAIFLAFVIRRLVTMLIIQDELSIKAEKIIKEAETTVNLAKTTVLANTLNASEQNYDDIKEKLELKEDLLRAEQSRIRELEEEILKWKTKYEEATATVSMGRGDE